jgi:uncharacterized protein (TIGR02246 family)
MKFSLKKVHLMIFLSMAPSLGAVLMAQSENPKQQIASKWGDFISNWQNQDAKGCASFFLEDGMNIPPDFPINHNRREISDFYELLFTGHSSSQYQHNILSVEFLGDDLLERGEFMVDWVRNDGSEWQFHARSLTHWVRDQQNDWKIKTFIFNSAPQE